MANPITLPAAAGGTAAHPYAPSWVDRLMDWIERRPFPPWVVYAGLGGGLVGLLIAVKAADGTYPAQFYLWHLVLALTGVYYLALVHGLDHLAARALAAFRPNLTVDDATYARLAYELTTMPARPLLGFTAFWGAWSLLLVATTPATMYQTFSMFTSPAASVVEFALWLLAWPAGGALIYHTIHQLGLVSRILTTYTRIDLFALQPLYAFSRLTAATAAGFVLIAYAWLSALPMLFTLSTAPFAVIMVLINIILVAATFSGPLWGVHRLIVAEKRTWQAALGARLRATILALQQAVDTGDRAAGTQYKDIFASLSAADAALDKVPTWPWNPATVQGLITAVFLPLVLWLITRVLERLLVF